MKPGDLIRNRRVKRSEFALSFTVFPRSEEDWMGIVLSLDQPNENTRYTTVRVLLSDGKVERSEFALSFQVFPRSEENWMGIVLSLDEPNENTRYTTVRVLLSDGKVESSWLLDPEIKEYVEVISEEG